MSQQTVTEEVPRIHQRLGGGCYWLMYVAGQDRSFKGEDIVTSAIRPVSK